MSFWQLEFQKYALILAGFLAGWARLAYINENRPGENLPFVWHIFQDIRLLALSRLQRVVRGGHKVGISRLAGGLRDHSTWEMRQVSTHDTSVELQ